MFAVLNVRAVPQKVGEDSTTYNQKLEKGIEAFYKTNWQRAGNIFKELKSDYPNNAQAYFFHSMIPFWDYYFGGRSEQSADLFLRRSQKAITVSRKQLQQNSTDTTMVLMLSGLYGYRSLVAASEKRYQTAVESGMTGFRYTRQLLALNADDPRAMIGKGMFYYMAGSVPGKLKWVTNMIGLSGDTEKGFKALKKAAESDTYVRNDAKMILAYLYEREDQLENARKYLLELVKAYPQNIIFQYNLARIQEKSGQQQAARQRYQKVLALENVDLQMLRQKSRKQLELIE
ncbi:Protein of unknown function (DUF3808) [Fodinibius salinus]|uniref:Uncharacterized protein n=2 Tax=Fodinibius salinus TaxID=860790 RepID=A0A5D3YMB6_9BACT|nr:Protein of unknown function (DUF3808) [Fodinibius salinus]